MTNTKATSILLEYIDIQDLKHIKKIFITKQDHFFKIKYFNKYFLNVEYLDNTLSTARLSAKEKDVLKREVNNFNKFFKKNGLMNVF